MKRPGRGAATARRRVYGALFLGFFLAAGWSVATLDLLSTSPMAPGGIEVFGDFLRQGLSPALDYQRPPPPGTEPLLWKVGGAVVNTVLFAGAAMSLALLAGLPLGLLASSALWSEDVSLSGGPAGRFAAARSVLFGSTRVLIAFMRSIHELLWAVLLLAGFGLNDLSAIFAIAIPYAGTLAKVFSELIDEAPRDCARALRSGGARPVQVFLFGLLPIALPDMGAYAFYRMECALRSSAVLGFFGFPTLGYYLAASFENLHYAEVWTYLYALILLVSGFDAWSGALRRRLA